MEPGNDKEALQNKLTEAEAKWSSVKQKCDKKCKDIDELYPLSQKYSEDAVTFSIWLDKAEKKKGDLETQPLLPNENDLKKQRKDTEVNKDCFCSLIAHGH